MSDRGGGITRSTVDQLFKYMYSTAPQPSKSDAHTVPLAGYGYGLPISRLYARYFHGDLVLLSCEGYGTDAVIYMKVSYLKWIRLFSFLGAAWLIYFVLWEHCSLMCIAFSSLTLLTHLNIICDSDLGIINLQKSIALSFLHNCLALIILWRIK